MFSTDQRFEAIEVDGRWFVLDRKYPADISNECNDEDEATLNARIWSLLASSFNLRSRSRRSW